MHMPETSGRMLKWAVELGQFDIEYKPKTTIKTQDLADFLIEFPPRMEVTGQEEPKQSLKEQVEDDNCSPCWTLYVDGAVDNN